MCAIFGFLDYGKKISASTLKRLLRALSVAAESRGTDATGISYVNNGNIVTFKKAKPAHKVKLYFPKDTTAVIGHTRFTTQGSEKNNYNNHPFEGTTSNHTFAELRRFEPLKLENYLHLIDDYKNMQRNTEEFRTFVQTYIDRVVTYPYHIEIVLDVGFGVTDELKETITIRRGDLYALFESRTED